MKITINRLDDAYHLQAVNEDGCTVETDGALQIGGGNKGMRPMQLMLVSAGSCSSIDVITILKKQKQPLEDIRVEISAEREQNKVPALFTKIHIHFLLKGDLDEQKVKKAIALSMEKYCSAVKILEKTAEVTSGYEIINA